MNIELPKIIMEGIYSQSSNGCCSKYYESDCGIGQRTCSGSSSA